MAMNQMLAHLRQGLRQMGIELTSEQLDSFETYRAELLDWNQRMNLTAITEPAEIEIRHFLDSLTVLYAIAEWQQDHAHLDIIDVGSGAGFPGLPLGLVLPNTSVTLLEATRKKVDFLTHLVSTLPVTNVQVVLGRAEDVGHMVAHRQRYDLAVARAVAPLRVLAEYCLPFVRVGGVFVALKKGDLCHELQSAARAMHTLGGADVRLCHIPLAQLPGERYLACSTKRLPTPALYPRRAGMPSKHPL